MGRTCAGLASSERHRSWRDAQTVFCHEASWVLGYGAQVHVAEDRNWADTKLRELVGDYQAVVVHPFNDPLVIAGHKGQ